MTRHRLLLRLFLFSSVPIVGIAGLLLTDGLLKSLFFILASSPLAAGAAIVAMRRK